MIRIGKTDVLELLDHNTIPSDGRSAMSAGWTENSRICTLPEARLSSCGGHDNHGYIGDF
jgi:hypothetical protein